MQNKKIRLSKPRSFKERWQNVLQFSKNNENKPRTDSTDNIYFENVPLRQELLTDNQMIIKEKIDYSNFTEVNQHINIYNLYECFHGILFYIYFYSKNKFNIEEIEIHFLGAKSVLWETIDKFNIMNIFDYENINTKIDIANSLNAFFGITFKRIKIQPKAYSIRSSILSNRTSHLVSFTFEGFDEENKKWDVLDERYNINNLICTGGFCLFYVHTTSKCYSSFKLKQTAPGCNNEWGFSLSGFDIHGVVYYRDDIFNFNEDLCEDDNINSNNVNYFSSIDPCFDMLDSII